MQDSQTLYHAKVYSAAGYSVIPINYESKQPTIAWREYQTRRATDQEIESWFNRGDSNIAIVTGSVSNLSVVDVDPRNGGVAIIKGKPLGRATAITGGHGYHYYFSHFPEASSCKPGAWKGVDIKSDGGYILVPPSKTVEPYRFTDGEPFPPERRIAPEWLKHEIKMLSEVKKPSGSSRQLTIGNGRGSFFKVTLAQVPEGGRNNHAAKLYGALLYEGVSSDKAAMILKLWNSNLVNPLPDSEVESVIESITASHVRRVKDNNKEVRSQ